MSLIGTHGHSLIVMSTSLLKTAVSFWRCRILSHTAGIIVTFRRFPKWWCAPTLKKKFLVIFL